MNPKVENAIDRINNILNAKYEKNPNFSDQRKDWTFFVSQPTLMILKRAAGKHLHLDIIDALIGEVNLTILGCEVFGVHGLDDNIIYFAEKLKIKED